MLRPLATLVGLALSAPALAQMEPGEWEFVSTSTSRLFAGPQTQTFKRCISKDDAANPDRWMSDPGKDSGCELTPAKRTDDSYTWQMECPKSNMRGTGSARIARATMDGETVMNGEVQGQKFELRTKVTGKRLGPCKN